MSNKSVLLIYGLPCSGKSMVVRSMLDCSVITIDAIITRIIDTPAIADFQRLADEIVDEMVIALRCRDSSRFIIEMGCLVPRKAISRIEQFMSEAGFRFTNVVLTAKDDVLIQRIVQRNADIDAGNSDSIKVDGPDYLTRFKLLFDDNQPASFIELDTTYLSRQQVLDSFNNNVVSKK